MYLIDADALEADGWCMNRTIQVSHNTMELQTKKPKDFPTIEPQRIRGRWIDETFEPWGLVFHPYKCDQCGEHSEAESNFCPNCGADMRGQ